MPRNASGVYSLPNPPVVPDTTILASDENDTRNDLAAEITNSLDRSGRGGMLASLRVIDGNIASPGLAFGLDVDTGFWRIGSNSFSAAAGGVDVLRFNGVTSAINAIDVFPSITAERPTIRAYGGDATVDLGLRPKSTSGRVILEDSSGNEILIAGPATASAVNELTGRNAATGTRPRLEASGGDTNISPAIRAKGTGGVVLEDGSGNEVLVAGAGVASAVNELTITNAATGTAPRLSSTGGDTNIPLDIMPKGSGMVRISDGADITKRAQIDASGISTGTVRTLKMANTDWELFAAGTRMLFQQTSAPTGWTKEASATYNDAALRFTTGTVGTGGADAFNTLFGTSKSTAGHTLATAEIPSHKHSLLSQAVLSGTGEFTIADSTSSALILDENNAGGATDLAAAMSNTGGGGSHSHTLNNMNLKWADCIIAAKN